MSLYKMRNWRPDWGRFWGWFHRRDMAWLFLAAAIPLAYWRGWDESARTAALLLILHLGWRAREDRR